MLTLEWQDWADKFSTLKAGHILWDGTAKNPSDPRLAVTTSRHFCQHVGSFGFLEPGNHILDVGCGNGRLCIGLTEYDITYEGFDTEKPCIDFCNTTFADYPQFKFQYVDVAAYSNAKGQTPASQFIFPYEDNSFDTVIVYSVFTHLCDYESADNYMKQIKRVLKPGGKIFCTWYRSPPNPATDFFGRTTYYEAQIMNLMQGFWALQTYGGHSTKYFDQWVILAYLTEGL